MRWWVALVVMAVCVNLALYFHGVRGPLPSGSATLIEPAGRGIIRIAGDERDVPFAQAPLDLAAMRARAQEAQRPESGEPALSALAEPPLALPPAAVNEPAKEPRRPSGPELEPEPDRQSEPEPVPELLSDSETASTTPVESVSSAAPTAESEVESPARRGVSALVAPLCGELSIFGPGQALDEAVAWLEAAGFEVSILPAREALVTGYWVLIPPAADRAESLDIVRRLREAGVEDVWRFSKGEWRNAVSLGLFKGETNAENRRARVAAKGFAPEVRPRFDGTEAYRLEYRATATAVHADDVRGHFFGRLQRDLPCEE